MQQGVTLASMAATLPQFIQRSAAGMLMPEGSMLSSQAGVPEDQVLVIVQLGGGNDGLNTVVPYGSDIYYKARPAIAIGAPGSSRNNAAALSIDGADGIGLHPAMSEFKEMMDDGNAAIIQGVGYPNPNRSHFTSMDIWHTANNSGTRTNGWVGRYFDCTCKGTPDPESGVSIGRETPLAMVGDQQKPVSFENEEFFKWQGQNLNSALEDPYHRITRSGSLEPVPSNNQMDFLMRTSLDAQLSSDRIRAAVAKRPLVNYPRNRLAQQLQTVGAMIRDQMRTRVYYVSLGGFDTHAGQVGTHQNLLGQVSASLKAFHEDMKAQGNNGRVLTMVFSEFGRRVRQNGSSGTDHGTAAPMYLVGDMVRPGLHGVHPSLTDLDNGDLKFTLDFRRVYAGILEQWLKAPSKEILRGTYKPVNVLKDGLA